MPDLMLDYITSLDSYGTADHWPGYWGWRAPSTSRGSARTTSRSTRS